MLYLFANSKKSPTFALANGKQAAEGFFLPAKSSLTY